MKKLKVWLLTLVSVMAIVCCLAACGSGTKAGTYKLYSMTVNGTEYKAGDEVPVLGKLADDYITITLNEDGTQTLACDGSTISMEMSGNSVVLKK